MEGYVVGVLVGAIVSAIGAVVALVAGRDEGTCWFALFISAGTAITVSGILDVCF